MQRVGRVVPVDDDLAPRERAPPGEGQQLPFLLI
jgi:hypothetical protein